MSLGSWLRDSSADVSLPLTSESVQPDAACVCSIFRRVRSRTFHFA